MEAGIDSQLGNSEGNGTNTNLKIDNILFNSLFILSKT